MITIEIEIPDELAQDVAPYKERLSELLALGLRVLKHKEQSSLDNELDTLLIKLGDADNLILPQSEFINGKQSDRLEPITISGTSMDAVVSEQRAPK